MPVTKSIEEVRSRLDEFVSTVENEEARAFLSLLLDKLQSGYRDSNEIRIMLRTLPDVLPDVVSTSLSKDELDVQWLGTFRDRLLATGISTIRKCVGTCLFDVLMAAHETGFHPQNEAYDWLARNLDDFSQMHKRRRGTVIRFLIEGDDMPSFELFNEERQIRGGKYSTMAVMVEFGTNSLFVRSLIMGFLRGSPRARGRYRGIGVSDFISTFTQSLGFTPTSLDDFSVETFSRQFEFYDSIEDAARHQNSLNFLSHIYDYIISLLPDDQDRFTFATGLTRDVLTRKDFHRRWRAGFRTYVHNPTDPVPDNPRWLLYPSAEELRVSNLSPHATVVDASFEDERLQRLLMSWLWSGCSGVNAVRSATNAVKQLLRTFGRDEQTGMPVATSAGILQWLASSPSANATKKWKGYARSLIDYGSHRGYLLQDGSVSLLLSIKTSHRDTGAEGVPADKEDMVLLRKELEQRSGGSLLDELVYCAFITISLTPLRLADVLALRLSDFVQENPSNIHSVRISTKADGNGVEEFQLPARVYRLLRSIEEATEDARSMANNDVGDYLFILPSRDYGTIRKLSTAAYQSRIRDACSKLGIGVVGARSVRKRYMTEVTIEGAKHNLNLLAMRPLTGHANPETTERYYVREDVRNYFEALSGIEIGVPNIKGTIVPNGEAATDAEMASERSVENGAGYCRNESCNIPGTLPCLMCKGFVTTPRCMPEMREALENVRRRIKASASNAHEREHLLKVERLYLGYLAVMKTMELEG